MSQELNKLIESILDEQTDNDEIYASELKGIYPASASGLQ